MFFNYTDTLQHICESYPVNHDDTLSNKQVIENARPLMFDFDYPIFDEDYRNVFETHFIRNFYIRQVGFESYGLFKFQLETWLNINMPYFNSLFKSEAINYDPLTNFKISETDKRTIDKTQDDVSTLNKTRNTDVEATLNKEQIITETSSESGSSSGENQTNGVSRITGSSESEKTTNGKGSINQDNFNRGLETDTPQNRLAITTNDGTGVIEYASSIKENTDKNSQNSSSSNIDNANEKSDVDSETSDKTSSILSTNLNGNTSSNDESNTKTKESEVNTENHSNNYDSNIKTIDDYISSKVGKVGSQTYAAMVMEYRNSFLRIERQIFKEMSELFMMVY